MLLISGFHDLYFGGIYLNSYLFRQEVEVTIVQRWDRAKNIDYILDFGGGDEKDEDHAHGVSLL